MEETKQFIDDDLIIEAPIEKIQEEVLDVNAVVENGADSSASDADMTDIKDNSDNINECAKDIPCEDIANEVESTDGIGDNLVNNNPDNEREFNVNSAVDLSRIEVMLEDLNRCFEQKIANDTHKAALFDRMYNELQSYKTDIYAKMLKPFILSTITLIDDTNSFLSKLEENESRKAEHYLRGMPDDLCEILEANGVDLYEEEGDVFNPRTQRAMKCIPTADADLDKHIARRLRRGYRWNGSVLKPELVQIYKYENQ